MSLLTAKNDFSRYLQELVELELQVEEDPKALLEEGAEHHFSRQVVLSTLFLHLDVSISTRRERGDLVCLTLPLKTLDAPRKQQQFSGVCPTSDFRTK